MKLQVIHIRIRNKCSCLNHDLFRKSIVDSHLCASGEIETSEHFFLNCINHLNVRNILFNSLSNIGNIDIDALLFGKDDVTYQENEKKKKKILEVHRYIKNSKRFQVYKIYILILSPLPAKPKGTLGLHSVRPSVCQSAVLVFRTFFPKRLQILTRLLACESVTMTNRSSLSFLTLHRFLAKLRALDLVNFSDQTVFRTFLSKCF